jgi:hypothetical protein
MDMEVVITTVQPTWCQQLPVEPPLPGQAESQQPRQQAEQRISWAKIGAHQKSLLDQWASQRKGLRKNPGLFSLSNFVPLESVFWIP